MASLGAKVLQTRSVELAMAARRAGAGAVEFRRARRRPPAADSGTIVCDEEEIVEKRIVTGVAYSRDEAKISLFGLPDQPGVSATIFGPLADANVNVDMIVQNVSRGRPNTANMEFTVGKREPPARLEIVARRQGQDRLSRRARSTTTSPRSR